MATTLSVTVMIIALAVLAGFRHAVTEKLYSFNGHVHIVPFDPSNSNLLTYSQPVYYNPRLIDSLKKVPHVVSVAPFAERPVIIQGHGGMEGVELKGVNKDYHFLEGITTTGAPIEFNDTTYSRQILLSTTTADRLNVQAGDTVQLDFIEEGMPRIRRAKVAGLYHSGMEEIDKMFAVCDLKLLQRINNWTADSINGYEIALTEEAYADTVANYIHFNVVKAPLEAYTTNENYSNIIDWLSLLGINTQILLVIMAVVAIINMGAILVILIVDRATMIGLLKALGMPPEGMRNVFLAIAGIIAGAGVLLGNIIGLGLCWIQRRYGVIKLPEETYYMKYAPIRIVWWQIITTDVATMAVCILCMWLPVLYIRRIQPARVLQFK